MALLFMSRNVSPELGQGNLKATSLIANIIGPITTAIPTKHSVAIGNATQTGHLFFNGGSIQIRRSKQEIAEGRHRNTPM